MTHRGLRVAVVGFLGLWIGGASVQSIGIELGLEAYTLDMAGAWSQAPVALSAAFHEVETMLAEQGIPAEDVAEISADFDEAVASVSETLVAFPTLVPVPVLAVGVEIPVHWVVIDGVRVAVGYLDDRFVRGVASGIGGVTIPGPLFETTFAAGGETASAAADLAFSTWIVSVDAVKRLDLVFLGANVLLGADVLRGSVTPSVDVDVPETWESGVDAALSALHLDAISWSAVDVHAGLRFEIGLPFLRLYAEGRFALPIALHESWWNLGAGTLAGALGMVIRF